MTVRKDNLIEQKLEVWKNTQMQVHMDMDFLNAQFMQVAESA